MIPKEMEHHDVRSFSSPAARACSSETADGK